MRIAVCSADMDERHTLSMLVETALLRRGILPEVVLLPLQQELLEAAMCRQEALDLALIMGAWDMSAMQSLCSRIPVILVGGKDGGPAAFDAAARYFIEAPVSQEALEKALTRCLGGKKTEEK